MSTKLVSKKETSGVKDAIIVDENGYYKILAGAFNTYNRQGVFYRIKQPDTLLLQKTILNRRITEGTLISEDEHPDYKGLNNKEIVARTIKLDTSRKCGHIKAVEFIDTGKCEPGWDGYNITIVYIWFKPSGPFGPSLKEALDNPDENVYFSVRSLVREKFVGRTKVRDVIDVSTWDHVYEGGIAKASQWNAVGIEEISACVNGLCYTDIDNITSGNESICEDGKCLVNTLRKMEHEVKEVILDW